jgi:hypothetical protein
VFKNVICLIKGVESDTNVLVVSPSLFSLFYHLLSYHRTG